MMTDKCTKSLVKTSGYSVVYCNASNHSPAPYSCIIEYRLSAVLSVISLRDPGRETEASRGILFHQT